MAGEIIPTVKLKLNEDLTCLWNCRGCGHQNSLYLFSETMCGAKQELQGIDVVSCSECARKFDVD